MSGAEIRRKLLNDPKVKNEAPAPAPSDRAIRRIMNEFKAAPVELQQTYRLFAWPSSMDLAALPWEASRDLLDLLAEFTTRGRQPPTNELAERYWRVTLAAPDADIPTRLGLAVRLLIFAKLGRLEEIGILERWIARRQWKADKRIDRQLPPLELTKDQLARVDLLYAELASYSLFDPAARRATSRLGKGSGDRIPPAPPEEIEPIDLKPNMIRKPKRRTN